MKSINSFIIVLTALSIAVFVPGCKKDEPTKPPAVSYIDGYKVTLTDTAGTQYNGDFFPLTVGYSWNYYGSTTSTTSTIINGTSLPDSPDQEQTIGFFKVLAARSITLPSGAYRLNPVVDWTNSGYDTSRYFMKDSAVYIKAFRFNDTSYLEMEQPLFIKSRLVAGDSWEAVPQYDMARMFANEDQSDVVSNLRLNARAKFFVAGDEELYIPAIGSRHAVRVEQENDISLSSTITDTSSSETYTMTLSAQLATVYHLIADSGIVHQNVTGSVTLSISGTGFSMKTTTRIDNCELFLTGIYSGGIQGAKIGAQIRQQTAPQFTSAAEQRLWKLSQTAVKKVLRTTQVH